MCIQYLKDPNSYTRESELYQKLLEMLNALRIGHFIDFLLNELIFDSNLMVFGMRLITIYWAELSAARITFSRNGCIFV